MINLISYVKDSLGKFEIYQSSSGKIDLKKADESDGRELTEGEVNKVVVAISKKMLTAKKDTLKEFCATVEHDKADYGKNLSTVVEKVLQKINSKSVYRHPHSSEHESFKTQHRKDLESGDRASFASAKPLAPADQTDPFPYFPEGDFIRIIDGGQEPDRLLTADKLLGLGRMEPYKRKPGTSGPIVKDGQPKKTKKQKIVKSAGYDDVFATSEGEHAKKGFSFKDKGKVDLDKLIDHLDLSDGVASNIRKNGGWVFKVHAGSAAAVPTKRKSAWNPKYVEGGRTASGSQEWVLRNQALNDRNVKIYKISKEGDINEYRYFRDKLLSLEEWDQAIRKAVTEKDIEKSE